MLQSGPGIVTLDELPWTPRAKRVIEYSIEEAQNLGHKYVDSEHILLGLLGEDYGIAAHVLRALGLRLEQVCAATRAILQRHQDETANADSSQAERSLRQWDDETLPCACHQAARQVVIGFRGKTCWLVKDASGMRYFRFQEEEYAILQLLDGRRSLDEIKNEFEAHFPPQKISMEELQRFLVMLRQDGLVVACP